MSKLYPWWLEMPSALGTDCLANGLSSVGAKARLAKYGINSYHEKQKGIVERVKQYLALLCVKLSTT
jgi:hypothetical protein